FDKLLPLGMVFPYDFGFIPRTIGEDGDPLDIIVISEFRSFTGCVIECRLIGAIIARQTEKRKTIRNDRFLGIPQGSLLFEDIIEADDLSKQVRDELESFFINYNKMEGKTFTPIKVLKKNKAQELIEKGRAKLLK